MRVKSIKPNKSVPGIYIIEFEESNSVAYIDTDSLIKLGLKKGLEVEKEKVDELIYISPSKLLFVKLKNRLLLKKYSEKQIVRYISTNKIYRENKTQIDIDQIIESLLKAGLLDDEKFANRIIEKRTSQKAVSNNAIKRELQIAGVDKTIILELTKDFNEEDDIRKVDEVADKFIRTKRLSVEDRKDVEKLKRHLLYKGYTFDVINSLIDRLSHNL